MASLISSLFLKLTANTTEFETGMRRAERKLKTTHSQIERTTKSIRTLGKAMATGVVATAFTRLTTHAIRSGSALTDLAASAQTGIEEFQTLSYLALKAGADSSQMAQALVRVQKSAADAMRGLSTASDAFNKLGINVDTFIKLSPEKMLEMVSKRLVQSKGDVTAYGAALDILGARGAPRLLEALKTLGVEGFDNLAIKVREAGQLMEKETAERLDAASDNLDLFKNKITIVAGEMVAAVMEATQRSTVNGLSSSEKIDYTEQIAGLSTMAEKLKLVAELQGKLKEAVRELEDGNYAARTGTGYFNQAMRDELTSTIATYQDLIQKAVSFDPARAALLAEANSLLLSLNATITVMDLSMTSLTSGLGDWSKGWEGVRESVEKADEAIEKATEGITGSMKEVSPLMDDMVSGVQAMSYSIENGLLNAARDGKSAFGDMAQYILAEINRILVRAVLLRPLFSAIGGLFGESTNIGQAFMGAFGGSSASAGATNIPARASGGPVSAGGAYLVGEKGPEIFTPSMSGTIIPNGAGGSRILIGQIDLRGADVAAVARLERGLIQLNASVEPRALAAVQGSYSRDPGYLTRG